MSGAYNQLTQVRILMLPCPVGLRRLLLTIAIAATAATPALACNVTVGIPGNAPLTGLSTGHVTGVIAETTILALNAIGCRVTARKVPFARMYQWVHEGKLDVATSVLATPDRTGKAWYSAPIVTEYTLVMIPKGKGFAMESASDLAGRTIGGQIGFRYPQLDGIELKLVRTRHYEVNIRKLTARRIDGVLIGSITGPYLAKKMGMDGRVEFLPRALGIVGLGSALSHKFFSKAQFARFNMALGDIMGSSEWKKILVANGVAEYLLPWRIASSGANAPAHR
jgi:ABC-type amino acid transport substrate-binding protein